MHYVKSQHLKFFIIVVVIFTSIVLSVLKQIELIKESNSLEKQLDIETQRIQDDLSKKDFQKPEYPPKEIPTGGGGSQSVSPENDAFSIGIRAKNEGNMPEAIRNLTIAASNPDENIRKPALNMLADCYMTEGNQQKTIETYETLLAIEHDEFVRKNIQEKLANSYADNGNLNKALEIYQSQYATSQSLDNVLKICDTYERMNNKEALIRQINEYTSKHPEDKGNFERYIQTKETVQKPAETEDKAIESENNPEQ